jgi:hypothetical protein
MRAGNSMLISLSPVQNTGHAAVVAFEQKVHERFQTQ